VGCRRKASKADLLRLVATPEGPRADVRATAPGRGVYLHRDPSCVRAGLKHGSIARGLAVSISPDEASNLLREIERELLDEGDIER